MEKSKNNVIGYFKFIDDKVLDIRWSYLKGFIVVYPLWKNLWKMIRNAIKQYLDDIFCGSLFTTN